MWDDIIIVLLSLFLPDKRNSLLKHGRIDIVQFIRDLPKTQHHNQLFQVDLMTSSVSSVALNEIVTQKFSDVLIGRVHSMHLWCTEFSVKVLHLPKFEFLLLLLIFFAVGGRKDVLVRSFTRTFVIADTGGG